MQKKYQKILKWGILLLLFAGLAVLCVKYLVPLCKMLATQEGREAFCLRVESFGVWAPAVFIALMAVQIIIAFVPGGPLELVGGMLFGGIWGTVYTVAGSLCGTLLVYCLVKRFGRPLVHFFVSEEKMAQFKILQDERKLSFWVFLLFLIPGIPKDLLTYIVPLTKMRGSQFVLLSTLGRFPALAASVMVGDSFYEGRYTMCIVICVIAAVAVFVGYQVKNYVMKEHDAS